MAPRRTRQQTSRDAKGKEKEVQISDEEFTDTETPNPASPTVQSPASISSQKRKRNYKVAVKRSLQDDSSSSSKPSSEHASPVPSPPKKIKRSSTKVHKKSPIPPPTLPSSWFNKDYLIGKWKDEFASKALGFCDLVDMKLLDDMHLSCIEKFKKTSCFGILNPGTISYPRLTRLFYLNLQANYKEEDVTLESSVAGVKISITRDLLVKLLGCDPDCVSDIYPAKAKCINLAKQNFLLPSNSSSRQLTHTSLKLEPKIIFTLLVRCVIPREHSRELLTDKLMELLWLVMNDYKVDTPSLIMDHMLKAVTSSRNRSLPYANFLPKIFQEFNVPLEDEEILKTGHTMINEAVLQRLDIVKTSAGVWKLVQDLTSEDIAGHPDLTSKAKSKKAAAPDPLENRLTNLEWEHSETREQVIEMIHKYNGLAARVEELQDLLEKIAEHQSRSTAPAEKQETSKEVPAEEVDADGSKAENPPDKEHCDKETSTLDSLASVATEIIINAAECAAKIPPKDLPSSSSQPEP